MADRAGLGTLIGMLLCAATLFVIAVGGFVVRDTLTSGGPKSAAMFTGCNPSA